MTCQPHVAQTGRLACCTAAIWTVAHASAAIRDVTVSDARSDGLPISARPSRELSPGPRFDHAVEARLSNDIRVWPHVWGGLRSGLTTPRGRARGRPEALSYWSRRNTGVMASRRSRSTSAAPRFTTAASTGPVSHAGVDPPALSSKYPGRRTNGLELLRPGESGVTPNTLRNQRPLKANCYQVIASHNGLP